MAARDHSLPPGFDKNTIRKILVIRLGPFGDGLLTTAYFETVKRFFPNAKLHYLIKEPYHKSAVRHPFIDKLVTIPESQGGRLRYLMERLGLVKRLRAEKYDLIIDSQNKPSSQYLVLLSGSRFRLGYDERALSWIYNIKASRAPKRYTASRRFDILKPLGIEEEPFQLYFPIPDDCQGAIDRWLYAQDLRDGRFVVIAPGSRQARKKWRTDYYAAVADQVQTELGLRVVLLWAPKEKEDAETMARLMTTRAVMAPPTSLEEGVALVKRCRLLICNDSGLNHMAVTTKTTTLALFGPMNPISWSPSTIFSHHHHLYVPGGVKLGDGSFGITPAMVLETAREILYTSSTPVVEEAG
ncbi:lipopolysaccharide heptosyltransferase I [Marinobacter nanhaiticus D15-8W]|uniref:Lipopolysaccharide heptosyltransferase family protein n=1 Tax=Marinobacter nanhaiticus D15-8W TaxID=626887 RepID=N6WVK3_9GAMM|nr:glycosyltransferase family 9 protein [Marinobacter nanhaiticus]ENO12878.1 lipopolysaccharide heptosyltransferase family protein [Marinobacter nanhaiticus D15-8W]BES70229.1 lipopolysaccharide heptosyltransferase I [Marinobacter nanhaiticus D15-8W]